MLGSGDVVEIRQTKLLLHGFYIPVAPQDMVLSSNYGASNKNTESGMCFTDEVQEKGQHTSAVLFKRKRMSLFQDRIRNKVLYLLLDSGQ